MSEHEARHRGRPDQAALAMPGLLRRARRAYINEIRAALAEAGCDDLPRNGGAVLAAVDRSQAQLSHITRELAVSKQAAGQLIDTLVSRGYVDRSVDPADRRRLVLRLTERGVHAAIVIGEAIEAVDARLAERVPAGDVTAARSALAALSDMGLEE
jgi:DNA-binding MarR family transcriptional regulator